MREQVPTKTASPAEICFATCLLLIGVFATACDRPAGGRRLGATVTVLDPTNEIIFNPVADMWAKFLLFAPLMSFDENGEIEPRLARSWEHSPDYREWTYHLRSDVLWHDGVPSRRTM